GAARSDGERPKRYRPESGPALLAKLGDRQAAALDRLGESLTARAAPEGPAVVELSTARACWQALGRDIARATERVWLFAPADAYAALGPMLRRAAGAVADTVLLAPAEVALDFAAVQRMEADTWPGEPILAVIDARVAVIGRRTGEEFEAQWSASPAVVAGATLAFERVREGR
ncbi:MAG TPA: hypothetical protein VG712_01855, partial [Gemmatimonadales bacterium]|nr:hypothetical protein [Gemmatimonadales bacterium]